MGAVMRNDLQPRRQSPKVMLPAALVPIIKQHGGSKQLANAASRRLDSLTDVRDVRHLADELERVRKIVGEVTGQRNDINEIASTMLEAVVKAGGMLLDMAARGERRKRADGRPEVSQRERLPTLRTLGFSTARAARWQIAAKLPDAERHKYKAEVLASDDGLLSIAGLVRRAEAWLVLHQIDEDNVQAARKKWRAGEAVPQDIAKKEKAARAYELVRSEPDDAKLLLILTLLADLKGATICERRDGPFDDYFELKLEDDSGVLEDDLCLLWDGDCLMEVGSYWAFVRTLIANESDEHMERVLANMMSIPSNKRPSFLRNLLSKRPIMPEQL